MLPGGCPAANALRSGWQAGAAGRQEMAGRSESIARPRTEGVNLSGRERALRRSGPGSGYLSSASTYELC